MDEFFLVLVAGLLLALALYAQFEIGHFTAGMLRAGIARTILVIVGIGFGLTAAASMEGTSSKVLTLLIGFGAVHVPAAAILFIKRQRGSRKS
ncbi:hypothetical protein RY831_21470 [Noviherbaspirillum sp. CPCC 100848]|uniref:Uncharacterized protein n=1 Tax=Noviherbaspirillum album TaxID=3080276 RepID=A0ABU6JDM1_9BURK|nr:hypothetical protein [Noviherbaspirillum sp. CPCC 100848]MEC4721742.1 hypothetical protein [Noviherbaspirillum sp. CPCC 100848]